jgi:hypothetical protein
MSNSAHVDNLEPLKALKSGLALFRSGARDSARSAQHLTQSAVQELSDKLRLWQQRQQQYSQELDAAQRAFTACRSNVIRDRDGRTYVPPCTAEAQRLEQAQIRLKKAESNVQVLRLSLRTIEEAFGQYRQESTTMDRFLDQELAQAEVYLATSLNKLANYQLAALAIGILGLVHRAGRFGEVGSGGTPGATLPIPDAGTSTETGASVSTEAAAIPAADWQTVNLPDRPYGIASVAISPNGQSMTIEARDFVPTDQEMQARLDGIADRFGITGTAREIVTFDRSAATANHYLRDDQGMWQLTDRNRDISGILGGRRPTLPPEIEPGGVERDQSGPGSEHGFRPGGERGF